MEKEDKSIELIEELAELIVLLADDDYSSDYIASRYLYDIYTKYTE